MRKFLTVLLLCALLILDVLPVFASFHVDEWMGDDGELVATAGNWQMSDEDSFGSPMASGGLPPVSNTVSRQGINLELQYQDMSGVNRVNLVRSNSSGYVSMSRPPEYASCRYLNFIIGRSSLPSVGKYTMEFLYVSNGGQAYKDNVNVQVRKTTANASSLFSSSVSVPFQKSSGDFYFKTTVNITSATSDIYVRVTPSGTFYMPYGGYVSVRFAPYTSSAPVDVEGIKPSEGEVEQGIADSIGDISSGVADIDDSLKEIIQTISNQLAAFWDQTFNLIHLPDLANRDKNTDRVIASQQETTDQITENADENTNIITRALDRLGNFIIDGLKSLFIPSDTFFKEYFDDLLAWFSDRFGFLSFPLELLVRLVDMYVGSDDVDCVLVLPALSVSGHELWDDMGFNMTEFLEADFMFVLDAIRLVSSIYLIMSFVHLCGRKWDEVMVN